LERQRNLDVLGRWHRTREQIRAGEVNLTQPQRRSPLLQRRPQQFHGQVDGLVARQGVGSNKLWRQEQTQLSYREVFFGGYGKWRRQIHNGLGALGFSDAWVSRPITAAGSVLSVRKRF
jgi:hypothetical protein